jgi:hypothetical protein
MRKILTGLVAAMLLVALPACSGQDGPDYTWLRAFHAVPDAPNMRVTFDDFVFRETVSFGTTTLERIQSLLKENGDSARFTAEFFAANGAIGGVLATLDVPIAQDSISTVVLGGRFDDLQPVVVQTPRRPRPLGSLYFQFAHAATAIDAVDVYVTRPEVELSATAPLASVDPLGYSPSIEVPFGALRIRLTVAGTLDVIYDSGERQFDESTLDSGPGVEWLFAVTESVAAGPSPVFLLGDSGRGSVSLLDVGTPATARAIHAIPALGAVNLEALTEPPETLLQGLEFAQRSAQVAVPAGQYALAFRALDAPEEPLASLDVATARGQESLAVLIAGQTGETILFTPTLARSVASEARLRFAHLAPEGDLVSIYLASSADEALSSANRFLFNRPPGSFIGHLAINPGTYFLSMTTRPVTDPTDPTDPVLLGPVELELAGGDVVTLALFAPEVEGEPETLQVLDDTLP